MKKKKTRISYEHKIALALFFLFLTVYLFTLCPTVFWWDSGELIGNIAVLGIPHRPGFPLYILTAKVFSLLPFFNFIARINLFSALCGAFSLALLFLGFIKIQKQLGKDKNIILAGALPVLLLGFTYSFWIQSIRAEVYALNILIFSVLLFLTLKILEKKNFLKEWLLFFLVLGLGLGNHHITLLATLLSFSILFLKKKIYDPKVWLGGLLFCLLGLSIYLYLPIRAGQNPILNWGSPQGLSGTFSLVLAFESLKQIHWNALIDRFSELSFLSFKQVGLPAGLVGLSGLLWVFFKKKIWGFFVVSLILVNLAVTAVLSDIVIPDNPDLHGYLVFSLVGLSLGFGWGVSWILKQVQSLSRHKAVLYAAALALTVVSLIPFWKNRNTADLSGNKLAYDFAFNTVVNLKHEACVIVDNTNLDFILRGLKYGDKLREDLLILNRAFMGSDWYVRQMRQNHPEFFQDIKPALSGRQLFASIWNKCRKEKLPLYIEFTERDSTLADFLIPSGYLFEVAGEKLTEIPEDVLRIQKKWEERYLQWSRKPAFIYDGDAQRSWALATYRMGYFYQVKNLKDQAVEKYSQILSVSPDEQYLKDQIEKLNQTSILQ